LSIERASGPPLPSLRLADDAVPTHGTKTGQRADASTDVDSVRRPKYPVKSAEDTEKLIPNHR
jgi:hypothetical protein